MATKKRPTVEVRDMYGDGSKWRLLINGYGVADWPPGKAAAEDWKAYAEECARVVCEALGAEKIGNSETGNEAKPLKQPVNNPARDRQVWPYLTPHVPKCVVHGTWPEGDEPCWTCEREASGERSILGKNRK